MAASIDRSGETEPLGLIPSHPQLRPADVLTGAFHNGRLAAVDVGVICPAASGAGLDCVSTMHDRKNARMQQFSDELEAGGVVYRPFAVSCWGRLHPEAMQMLHNIAKRMARRDGTTTQRAILSRLQARITTEVMRRAARMLLRCSSRAEYLETQGSAGDEAQPTLEASLRAGHPGYCRLPPLYPAPQGGPG